MEVFSIWDKKGNRFMVTIDKTEQWQLHLVWFNSREQWNLSNGIDRLAVMFSVYGLKETRNSMGFIINIDSA